MQRAAKKATPPTHRFVSEGSLAKLRTVAMELTTSSATLVLLATEVWIVLDRYCWYLA